VRRVAVHHGAEEVELRVDLDGQMRVHQRVDGGFGPERQVRRDGPGGWRDPGEGGEWWEVTPP
jgi:hypothetical protein